MHCHPLGPAGWEELTVASFLCGQQVKDYFSYEHFYVLYCKFWELDSDHDLLIDASDLARHSEHGMLLVELWGRREGGRRGGRGGGRGEEGGGRRGVRGGRRGGREEGEKRREGGRRGGRGGEEEEDERERRGGGWEGEGKERMEGRERRERKVGAYYFVGMF